MSSYTAEELNNKILENNLPGELNEGFDMCK